MQIIDEREAREKPQTRPGNNASRCYRIIANRKDPNGKIPPPQQPAASRTRSMISRARCHRLLYLQRSLGERERMRLRLPDGSSLAGTLRRPGSSVVERGPEKAGVGGSIPSLATTQINHLRAGQRFRDVETWLKQVKKEKGLENPTLDRLRRIMTLVFKSASFIPGNVRKVNITRPADSRTPDATRSIGNATFCGAHPPEGTRAPYPHGQVPPDIPG